MKAAVTEIFFSLYYQCCCTKWGYVWFVDSCGTNTLHSDMVSRRRILSRSRDDLNLDSGNTFAPPEEEEDVWYQKDKLYKVS